MSRTVSVPQSKPFGLEVGDLVQIDDATNNHYERIGRIAGFSLNSVIVRLLASRTGYRVAIHRIHCKVLEKAGG